MPDVFDRLGVALKDLPDDLKNLYKKATKEAVISTGKEAKEFLKRNSGSQSLNEHIKDEIVIDDDYIAYRIDWDDIEVNKDKRKGGYGTKHEIKRESGKRNYTLRPATYHDLAYIIDFGHTVHFKNGSTGFVEGTRFIQRTYDQVIKGWKKRRDEQFIVEAQKIAQKFD